SSRPTQELVSARAAPGSSEASTIAAAIAGMSELLRMGGPQPAVSGRRSAAAISATRSRAAVAVASAGSRTALNSAPTRRLRSAAGPPVACHARHSKNLRPPGGELVTPRWALVPVLEMGWRPEGDVVGTGLRQRHGIVAR